MTKKVYNFFDKSISIGNCKFSLFLREYLQLTANVLRRRAKISDMITNKFFKINFAQNNGKEGENYFSTDFRSFGEQLTRLMMIIVYYNTHTPTLDSRPRPLQEYTVAVSRIHLMTSYITVIGWSTFCNAGHVVCHTSFVMPTGTRSAACGLGYLRRVLSSTI